MSKPQVFKDYGQESFTLQQIKAYRQADKPKERQRRKPIIEYAPSKIQGGIPSLL